MKKKQKFQKFLNSVVKSHGDNEEDRKGGPPLAWVRVLCTRIFSVQRLRVVHSNSGGDQNELRRWSDGTLAVVGRNFGDGRQESSGGGRKELRQWSEGTPAVVGMNFGGGQKESSQISPFFLFFSFFLSPFHEKSEGYL
ncbi:hypothetical protein M5K25_022565 [Dendrobium thyrsiflorum]|uniref:Uncharacterized protein n=1 Tax=Dendrobium thyrsiflorum TaxID=117978 RepID=A0ABD0U6E4_DENTH